MAPGGGVRLVLILQALTAQELAAFFTLLEGVVLDRLGGPEGLRISMEGLNLILTPAFAAGLAEAAEPMVKDVPDDVAQKLEQLQQEADRLKARQPKVR